MSKAFVLYLEGFRHDQQSPESSWRLLRVLINTILSKHAQVSWFNMNTSRMKRHFLYPTTLIFDKAQFLASRIIECKAPYSVCVCQVCMCIVFNKYQNLYEDLASWHVKVPNLK